jgi:hypothetical protein
MKKLKQWLNIFFLVLDCSNGDRNVCEDYKNRGVVYFFVICIYRDCLRRMSIVYIGIVLEECPLFIC